MTSNGLTLVVLPHAGGNAGSFLPLARYLRGDIQVLPLDFPGHGRRMGQPLLDDIPALAQDILGQLRPSLDKPYAVFGHSMGALAGLALCHAAAREGLPLPRRLYVSGCSAPGHSGLPPDLADRPEEPFWAEIRRFGGLPQEVLAEPAILEFFGPILRADLRAVADYKPLGLSPLPLPISVLSGDDDHLTKGNLDPWAQCSTLPLSWHWFSGDHFFVFRHLAAVATVVNRL